MINFIVKNVESGRKTPSEIAKSWQGTGKYPGIDDYVDVIVKRYINHKDNDGEDVYLLRNGSIIPFNEIQSEFNS